MGEDQINVIVGSLGRIEEAVNNLKSGQTILFSKVDSLAVHGCARGEEQERNLDKIEVRLTAIEHEAKLYDRVEALEAHVKEPGPQGVQGMQGVPGHNVNGNAEDDREFRLWPPAFRNYKLQDVAMFLIFLGMAYMLVTQHLNGTKRDQSEATVAELKAKAERMEAWSRLLSKAAGLPEPAKAGMPEPGKVEPK
jgi:hypothetical protein